MDAFGHCTVEIVVQVWMYEASCVWVWYSADLVWYGMADACVVGIVWCSGCGMVWYGMVRYGMVWYGGPSMGG